MPPLIDLCWGEPPALLPKKAIDLDMLQATPPGQPARQRGLTATCIANDNDPGHSRSLGYGRKSVNREALRTSPGGKIGEVMPDRNPTSWAVQYERDPAVNGVALAVRALLAQCYLIVTTTT